MHLESTILIQHVYLRLFCLCSPPLRFVSTNEASPDWGMMPIIFLNHFLVLGAKMNFEQTQTRIENWDVQNVSLSVNSNLYCERNHSDCLVSSIVLSRLRIFHSCILFDLQIPSNLSILPFSTNSSQVHPSPPWPTLSLK